MTRFDELDEQTQRQWRSRLEKGRLGLSASVEQTLAEGVADEEWMDEDGEEGGIQVVDEHMGEVHRGTAVIPPRLSLQTKPMYTVATAANRSEVPVPAVRSQESSQEKQHTGVFSRLARRITMSLAAITSPFQAQVPVPQPPAQEIHVPMPDILSTTNLGVQTVTTVRVEHSETTTTIIEASPMQYAMPSAGIHPVPSVPQLSEQVVQGEGRSRLAGYPSKVHLEAAPKGMSLHATARASEKAGEASYHAHGSTEPLPLRHTFTVPRSAPTLELPIVTAAAMEEAVYDKTTSGRMPSVQMPNRGSNNAALVERGFTGAPSSWALFGSGNFDAGQGDVAVVSPDITGNSVVMVMLASDPGPVVVQYISLQPGIGFTVHLSAPTKLKTLFNYVVLRGES